MTTRLTGRHKRPRGDSKIFDFFLRIFLTDRQRGIYFAQKAPAGSILLKSDSKIHFLKEF
ncbi:MAG: hypothetical protein DRP79_00905 [Planctomycetota bacterium]|nr:MAG: hypothetical protein DRP79_00905 [Planctomycetota bacterium]